MNARLQQQVGLLWWAAAIDDVPRPAGETMDTATASSGPMPRDWWHDHFDHFAPELAGPLYETLKEMRGQCPVARSDQHGGFWVVTRYEDVIAVAQDWATFSSAHGLTVSRAPTVVRNLPVEADPPEQRIFKRLINPYFTPGAVAAFEQATRQLVTRLIDNFIEAGSCEFMGDFARPYPSRAFFELAINAPAEDIDRVAYLASKSSTPKDPEAAQCWLGLYNWIKEFVAARRSEPPRGDVVDAILRAEINGRPITEDEIVGTVQLIILGGLETTASALGLMVYRFCRQPEILAQLRRRPELLPAAIEELLRLDGPFIAIARTAVRDGRIADQAVKTGDKVLLYWASANRDDAEFPNPDDFEIDRERNRHLAFGVGPHRCAGSNLARLNLRVALEEILDRLRDVALPADFEIAYHSTVTRSPLTLPLTFTPGPRRL
jgi:cytochrome P450